MEKSNECVATDCGTEEYARGLCKSHYRLARLAVKQGITTWDQLVKEGMAAPEKKRGPAPSEFAQAIEAIGNKNDG